MRIQDKEINILVFFAARLADMFARLPDEEFVLLEKFTNDSLINGGHEGQCFGAGRLGAEFFSASRIRPVGTAWPHRTLPIRRAKTNFRSPATTFLSNLIAAKRFFSAAAPRRTWVGKPARSN